jgi:hypothetical protein
MVWKNKAEWEVARVSESSQRSYQKEVEAPSPISTIVMDL